MVEIDYSDVARDFLRLVGIAPLRPDLAYLTKLARAFSKLPYENFTKIIRAEEIEEPDERPRMPDLVLTEHVELGTGGTCFSLAQFFSIVLGFAGFEAKPVMCDRSYGPNTHCAIIVPLGRERYLVDPGYLMEEPLAVPKEGESVQRGDASIIRLRRLGRSSQLILITERRGVAKLRYRLRDVPIGNESFRELWIDSFDWAMMRHLTASKRVGEGQLFMRDGMLRLVNGKRKRQDRIDKAFSNEIERAFGIDKRVVLLAEDRLKRLREGYLQSGKEW